MEPKTKTEPTCPTCDARKAELEHHLDALAASWRQLVLVRAIFAAQRASGEGGDVTFRDTSEVDVVREMLDDMYNAVLWILDDANRLPWSQPAGAKATRAEGGAA